MSGGPADTRSGDRVEFAWAISTGKPYTGHNNQYVSYLWFNGMAPDGTAAHNITQRRPWFLNGIGTAVFETRRDARRALKILKSNRHDILGAQVVKVAVIIREVSPK